MGWLRKTDLRRYRPDMVEYCRGPGAIIYVATWKRMRRISDHELWRMQLRSGG